MIPHPDYGSRLMLWRNALMREGCTQAHLSSPTLDLSSLAKISDGYTAGDITKVSRQVLTARRIQTLAYKPLLASEFVPALARLDPIDPEQELEYKNWQLKTPMGKKRAALKAPADDDDGGGKGKKGKKGSGKKKKKKK
jgi:IQ and AAA domain-containing protein